MYNVFGGSWRASRAHPPSSCVIARLYIRAGKVDVKKVEKKREREKSRRLTGENKKRACYTLVN